MSCLVITYKGRRTKTHRRFSHMNNLSSVYMLVKQWCLSEYSPRDDDCVLRLLLLSQIMVHFAEKNDNVIDDLYMKGTRYTNQKIYKCESSSPVSVVRIYTSALFLYWWKVSIINLRPPRAICRKNQIFVYILFLLRKWNVISLEVAHMTHLNLVHMLHEGYHHTWHHAALTSTISKNLKKKKSYCDDIERVVSMCHNSIIFLQQNDANLRASNCKTRNRRLTLSPLWKGVPTST